MPLLADQATATGGFWGQFRPQVQQFVQQRDNPQPPPNGGMSVPQVNQPWFEDWARTHGFPGGGSSSPPVPQPNLPQQPQMGGATRRGSQILDAQGNVIGHYDDNNQPVYHGGQGGGSGQTPPSWNLPGQRGPIWTGGRALDYPEHDMRASTSMGMAPRYAQLGVPGSMQQSLYGSGLLRPAMPSMNNQSGY